MNKMPRFFMMETNWCSKILLSLLSVALLPASAFGAGGSYRLLKELSFADSGAWNVFKTDVAARRLYAASSSCFVVVDLEKEQLVSQFINAGGIQSFDWIAQFGRGYFLKSGDPNLTVVKLGTFEAIEKVTSESGPKLIAVDPEGSHGYVFNAGDNTFTVFEPNDGTFMGNRPFPGVPRNTIFEKKSRQFFCALDGKDQIAVFKMGQESEAKTMSVSPGEKPDGLAFDPIFHRLLVGCGNNKLVLMDAFSGKVLDSVSVETGAAVLALDADRRLVFATGGNGTVTVLRIVTPHKLQIIHSFSVPAGAHHMVIDPKTHKLFLGTDSKILVYGQ
jgi:DNA-binding beta-propeller fold protein YncE